MSGHELVNGNEPGLPVDFELTRIGWSVVSDVGDPHSPTGHWVEGLYTGMLKGVGRDPDQAAGMVRAARASAVLAQQRDAERRSVNG